MQFGWAKENYKRIAWHMAVVASAAVLTYLLEELKMADFGENTALIVGGLSFVLKSLLEGVRKG